MDEAWKAMQNKVMPLPKAWTSSVSLKNATVLTSIMNSEVVVPGSIMSGYLDRG